MLKALRSPARFDPDLQSLRQGSAVAVPSSDRQMILPNDMDYLTLDPDRFADKDDLSDFLKLMKNNDAVGKEFDEFMRTSDKDDADVRSETLRLVPSSIQNSDLPLNPIQGLNRESQQTPIPPNDHKISDTTQPSLWEKRVDVKKPGPHFATSDESVTREEVENKSGKTVVLVSFLLLAVSAVVAVAAAGIIVFRRHELLRDKVKHLFGHLDISSTIDSYQASVFCVG